MSDPTIEVVSLIDEDIIYKRICAEWEIEQKKALQEVADKLEKKYFYRIEFYESDGIYDWGPTPELKALQNSGGRAD